MSVHPSRLEHPATAPAAVALARTSAHAHGADPTHRPAPATGTAPVIVEASDPGPAPVSASGRVLPAEDGSLVTEYGLLAVVAATIAGVVISWSSGGALVTLFNALLRQARTLVGA